ncbi:GyrI-like domain-containing protein [Bowmanella dokdonensis]|uniref:GyrI-like domain-containing protein n=1 Tax=Bowmanella dokdonensis TaxID=751969 RepID=A0A939ISL6_9ALTE|nr:GyrI-like domain-containing protein [Bowmanella dokdonensis]MBN7826862.1 GyrI-like domain-containing protein [Bowmanella dokdonensis]
MEVIEHPKLLVVGLPVMANWHELWQKMPRAWQTLFARQEEIPHRRGCLDCSLDKREEQYLQLVGCQVSRLRPVPPQMQAVEIPAQRYLHHTHLGPTSAIAETFGLMYEWASVHGLQVGEFKLDRGYRADGRETEHDLYIGLNPVKPWREVR